MNDVSTPVRRLVLSVDRRWEVPLDEEKLKKNYDPESYEDYDIKLMLEANIEIGDTTPKRLAEELTADPDHQDYLGESLIHVEVEHQCPKHPTWWYNPSTNLDLHVEPCFLCRREAEQKEKDERS